MREVLNTMSGRKGANAGRAVKSQATWRYSRWSRSTLTIIALQFIAYAIVAMMLSIQFPWGNLSAHTSFAGINVDVDADVYVQKIDYEASGKGKVALANRDVNISMAAEKTYTGGLGEFQETIGFIKGSGKDFFYCVTFYSTSSGEEANLEVWTHADLIPWWPVGVPQKCQARVVLKSITSGMESITVTGTQIKMLPGDGDMAQYDPVKLASKGMDTTLTKVGDSATTDFSVTLSKDYGYIRIFALADMTAKGKASTGDFKAQQGYSSTKGPGGIALWTIGQDRTARIGMMVAAYPMLLVGVIFAAIAMVAMWPSPKWAWRMGLVAAVLLLLAVPFFMTGTAALIELTGYYKWFSWDTDLVVPWLGAIFMAMGAAFLLVIAKGTQPPKVKTVKVPAVPVKVKVHFPKQSKDAGNGGPKERMDYKGRPGSGGRAQ
jgi:hypothetical protein